MNPIKIPTECGRYEFDGDLVTVYWSNGELLADNGFLIDTVDEFDRIIRDDLHLECPGQCPDEPWAKVGVCCDDDCEGDCHETKPEKP